MPTVTTTTMLTEIIPVEHIADYIDGFNYPAATGMLVASIMPGMGSIPHRFPRWSQITVPAGTKTEGADATAATLDTAEGSVTPGIVIFEEMLSDEVLKEAVVGIPEGALQESIAALVNRIDVDIHSASTSSTNTQGTTADVFNREKFSAAAAAYRALNIRNAAMMDHACVVGHSGLRDLDADEVVTTASKAQDDGFKLFGSASGYIGKYGGFQLFNSGNVATEAPGYSNYMTPIGMRRSGLSIVMTEGPRVEHNRGSEGARAAADFYVFRAWYGAGLTNTTKFLEVLSRA